MRHATRYHAHEGIVRSAEWLFKTVRHATCDMRHDIMRTRGSCEAPSGSSRRCDMRHATCDTISCTRGDRAKRRVALQDGATCDMRHATRYHAHEGIVRSAEWLFKTVRHAT